MQIAPLSPKVTCNWRCPLPLLVALQIILQVTLHGELILFETGYILTVKTLSHSAPGNSSFTCCFYRQSCRGGVGLCRFGQAVLCLLSSNEGGKLVWPQPRKSVQACAGVCKVFGVQGVWSARCLEGKVFVMVDNYKNSTLISSQSFSPLSWAGKILWLSLRQQCGTSQCPRILPNTQG